MRRANRWEAEKQKRRRSRPIDWPCSRQTPAARVKDRGDAPPPSPSRRVTPLHARPRGRSRVHVDAETARCGADRRVHRDRRYREHRRDHGGHRPREAVGHHRPPIGCVRTGGVDCREGRRPRRARPGTAAA